MDVFGKEILEKERVLGLLFIINVVEIMRLIARGQLNITFLLLAKVIFFLLDLSCIDKIIPF